MRGEEREGEREGDRERQRRVREKERERKMGGMGRLEEEGGQRGGTRSLPRAGFKSSLSPVSRGPGVWGRRGGQWFSPPAGASANFR